MTKDTLLKTLEGAAHEIKTLHHELRQINLGRQTESSFEPDNDVRMALSKAILHIKGTLRKT